MSFEEFFYALPDHPEKVGRLAAEMEPYFQSVRQVAAGSPAEVIPLGGNYEGSITTHPQFSRRYLLPAVRGSSKNLHRGGRYLLTHTDGEYRSLLDLYVEAGVDVADSICP